MKELKALPEPDDYASMEDFAKALAEHNKYLDGIDNVSEYCFEELIQQALKIKLGMQLLKMMTENNLAVTKKDNTAKQETPPTRPDDVALH